MIWRQRGAYTGTNWRKMMGETCSSRLYGYARLTNAVHLKVRCPIHCPIFGYCGTQWRSPHQRLTAAASSPSHNSQPVDGEVESIVDTANTSLMSVAVHSKLSRFQRSAARWPSNSPRIASVMLHQPPPRSTLTS
ncbi:hypothetical protein V9T40_000320 [Parthenolecanium corni]|uniref:Uncharacterized protein n=1 Tax=Parthenolecanium corni TaxID=536013 RepID=A0AAN9TQ78_9HEMI